MLSVWPVFVFVQAIPAGAWLQLKKIIGAGLQSVCQALLSVFLVRSCVRTCQANYFQKRYTMTKPHTKTFVCLGQNMLMWILLLGIMCTHAYGQVQTHEHLLTCDHLCARVKTQTQKTGIYPQDERVHHYDIKFYGIDLTVDPFSTYITGSTTVKAVITEPQTRFFVLELWHELTVSEVLFQQESIPFSHSQNVLEIDLGIAQQQGTMVKVEVFYSGAPQPQGFFSGIQSSANSYGDPVLYTLSEPHNARQWFPCKQVLADKPDSAYIFITTPPGYIAASNGLLTQVVHTDNNMLRYEWKTFYPITYYLLSMAVTNYQEYNFYAPMAHSQDSVFIQNFIYNYPEVLENQRENLERTRDFMQLFSQKWGNYPFSGEKYGHAQAPMGGGMEHQTLSTMGYFGFDITAHELAHHWFGNHVSCATWSDIWINEGFASYGEYLAREYLLGAASAAAWMQSAHDQVKSAPGGSVYIPPYELTDVWRIFNGRLSYKKGAAIIHQLRFELNDDDLFFYIMEDFQNTFAHSVATGDNFREVVEVNTSEPWEWFFDQWYYGEGYPIYEIKWWQQQDMLIIQSSQNTSATLPSFFAGTLEFEILYEDQSERVRVFQHEPLQQFAFDITGNVQNIVFDPEGYMLKHYTLWDSTHIDSFHKNGIQIMPNPFYDSIEIRCCEAWRSARIIITDIQGRIVRESTLTSGNQRLYLKYLLPGSYVLQLHSPTQGIQTFRLVKSQ